MHGGRRPTATARFRQERPGTGRLRGHRLARAQACPATGRKARTSTGARTLAGLRRLSRATAPVGRTEAGPGGPTAPRPDGLVPPGGVRLGASYSDHGDGGFQQVPGTDRAERADPQADGTVRSARQDAPRMSGVPLELPAGSRDVAPGGNGDPVPVVVDPASQPAIAVSSRNEDEERTSPLPVILPARPLYRDRNQSRCPGDRSRRRGRAGRRR